ncbi:MAG TPA: helix-turn-helix domain-containing protein [Steroidobacteraceae bacterium]|nr:helix-turn-helix domain-containing protein [Steroidobacteraceae bacterium]
MNQDTYSAASAASFAHNYSESFTPHLSDRIDEPRRVRVGEFLLDLNELSFSALGHSVQLTKLEARVLAVLLSHSGRFVNTVQLIAVVWSGQRDATRNTLKQIIFRLRRKLSKHPDLSAPLTSSVGGYAWLIQPQSDGVSVHDLLAQSAWTRSSLSL